MKAHALGQNVPKWRQARQLRRQTSRINLVLNHRVVACQAPHTPVAVEVRSAVTHVRHVRCGALDHQEHHCRAHAVELWFVHRLTTNLNRGLVERVTQPLPQDLRRVQRGHVPHQHGLFGIVGSSQKFCQNVNSHLTRNFARRMTAHAICDHKEPMLCIVHQGIFVVLSNRTTVRTPKCLDDHVASGTLGGVVSILSPRRLAPEGARVQDRSPYIDKPSASASGSGEARGRAADVRAGDTIGPYVVDHRIAVGGMGAVYQVHEAEHPERRLALKLLHGATSDSAALSRFRREFRALARLRHPNVLEVIQFGTLEDRAWYTMRLIDGHDLRDEMATWSGLTPEARNHKVRDILIQIARALDHIHDRGLVHRDVTPSNLMVNADGHVLLMDFGLVKDQSVNLTQVDEVLGTLAFAAPEQILGKPVDARTDLYSLGAVLYLLLTGKKPFHARTVQGYMDRHLHEDPRPPEDLDPLISVELSAICLRLLQKVPEDRYATAAHLLHTLGASDAIEDYDAWPPRVIGRLPIKAALTELMDELSSNRSGPSMLLTGGVGEGKSRLLEWAEDESRKRGLRILHGSCRSNDRPFGPFVDLYEDLLDVAPCLDEEQRQTLDTAFSSRETRMERYPVLAAYRTLLAASAPAILLLDNVDQASASTRELLSFLVRNLVGEPNMPIGFLVTHTSETATLPSSLAELSALQHMHLEPLQAQEVEELVLSIVESSPAAVALATRLHEETRGNPSFLADTLKGLKDEGLLKEQSGRWEVTLPPEEISHSRLPMPASVRQLVAERLAPLSAEALQTAQVLALARGGLQLDTLMDVVELDESTLMDALDELVDAHIVVEERDNDEDFAELAHNRFRDVLVEGVEPTLRAMRHRAIGEALERQHRHALGPFVEDLAYHFEHAGLPPKAYAFLLQTANKHLQRSLHAEALQFLDRCLTTEPMARPHLLLDEADRTLGNAHYSRAKALYHLGRWDEAIDAGRAAAQLADAAEDEGLSSRVHATLGEHLRNRGFDSEAEFHLRRALDQADMVQDESLKLKPLYHLGAVLWSYGRLDDAERLWHQTLTAAQEQRNARAEGLAMNGLGILAICRGGSAEARRMLETAAALFERLGMNRELAVARVNLIELYLSVGVLRKALQLAEATTARAREVQHQHGVALGLVWRARLLRLFSRLEEARRNAIESLRLSRILGTVEEEILSLTTLVEICLDLDDGSGALTRARELATLLGRHDPEGVAPQAAALLIQALVADGDREGALSVYTSAKKTAPYPLVHVRTAIDMSTAAFHLGLVDDAVDLLSTALQLSEQHGFRYYQLVARHRLAQRSPDANAAGKHARIAKSLARTLAANLPRDLAAGFLARNWGAAP